MTRASGIVALLAVVLLASGCGGNGERAAGQSQAELADIRSVSDLRAAFNEAKGTPRLVVIFSPT